MSSSSPSLPIRSISLPSRVHPTSIKLEAALNHLKSFQNSFVSTSESLQHAMVGVAEMYNCLQDYMGSTQAQRALGRKLMEERLNESVTLLDAFDAARDAMVTMKEHLQSFQSALRRHRGFEHEVSAYLSFRKKVRRDISVHLSTIKKLESKYGAIELDLSNVDCVLREASSITIFVLKLILVCLCMPGGKTKTRVGPFSLISKMISMKKGQNLVNEVGSVDLGLCSLIGQLKISDSKVDLQMVQNMLENLDDRISGLESGLNCVFKCLVQNRVTLLNIMTQ